jgi:hypothetical protein
MMTAVRRRPEEGTPSMSFTPALIGGVSMRNWDSGYVFVN